MGSDFSDSPSLLCKNEVALPDRIEQILMRPMGWPFFSLMTVTCGWALWEARVQSAFAPAILTFIGLGTVWGARLVLQVILIRRYPQEKHRFFPGIWRHGIVFAVALIMLLLLMSGVPVQVGFQLSKAAMQREADRIIANESAKVPQSAEAVTYKMDWVGVYRVTSVVYLPKSHAVLFMLDGKWVSFVDVGWLYCADEPGNVGYVQRIEGPWYSWNSGS